MSENNFAIKATARNQSLVQSDGVFNQHKFISDIYECEKQKYILEKRALKLNTDNKKLLKSRPVFEHSEFYKNYKKECQQTSGWENPKKFVFRTREEYKKNSMEEYKKDYIQPNRSIIETTLRQIRLYPFKTLLIGVVPGILLSILLHSILHSLLISVVSGIVLDVFVLILYFIIINKESNQLFMRNYNEYVRNLNFIIESTKSNIKLFDYWEEKYNNYSIAKNAEIDKNMEINNNELNVLRKEIYLTENTLKMLYNLRLNGVLCLHPNYQGLVPISIIYGYFDTGRCSQLQGHEGAYNLYEDEKMKGMIIGKLNVVLKQINQLNRTMVYVGQAIEECNERLSDLESASNRMISSVNNMNSNVSDRLNGVSNQMSAIEANTANSAYYAEVGARMSTFNTVYNLLSD